jgi:hypothetical protein
MGSILSFRTPKGSEAFRTPKGSEAFRTPKGSDAFRTSDKHIDPFIYDIIIPEEEKLSPRTIDKIPIINGIAFVDKDVIREEDGMMKNCKVSTSVNQENSNKKDDTMNNVKNSVDTKEDTLVMYEKKDCKVEYIYGSDTSLTFNNKIIIGDRNIIFGDNNKISGDKCTIYGDNNTIDGQGCVIIGNGNLINKNIIPVEKYIINEKVTKVNTEIKRKSEQRWEQKSSVTYGVKGNKNIIYGTCDYIIGNNNMYECVECLRNIDGKDNEKIIFKSQKSRADLRKEMLLLNKCVTPYQSPIIIERRTEGEKVTDFNL